MLSKNERPSSIESDGHARIEANPIFAAFANGWRRAILSMHMSHFLTLAFRY
jgi:hypothetical protein